MKKKRPGGQDIEGAKKPQNQEPRKDWITEDSTKSGTVFLLLYVDVNVIRKEREFSGVVVELD